MQEPLTGPAVCVTVAVLQLSVAVATAQLTFQQVPAAVGVFTTFAGQVMTGGVASVAQGSTTTWVTTTLKAQIIVLPLASVAIYFTRVVPIGKHEPFAPPTSCATEGVPQLSVAAGVVQEALAQLVVVVKLMLVGQEVKVGGMASVKQGSVPPQLTPAPKRKLKSPCAPSLNVNQPLPPSSPLFCQLAPTPTWNASPRCTTVRETPFSTIVPLNAV